VRRIVPRISNSNEIEHSGRITKRGTKLGRTTLVQCALLAQRYSPYLKKYYEKKKSRGHRESDHRAGPQIPGNHLSNAQEQLGVRRFPQLCPGGGSDGMTFKTAAYHTPPLHSARLRSGSGGSIRARAEQAKE
jgi:hypothetical protein